jgi:hypothetical protein
MSQNTTFEIITNNTFAHRVHGRNFWNHKRNSLGTREIPSWKSKFLKPQTKFLEPLMVPDGISRTTDEIPSCKTKFLGHRKNSSNHRRNSLGTHEISGTTFGRKVNNNVSLLYFFFWETQYKYRCSRTHAYTHPYERTHVYPTPMSTFGRLSRRIESWKLTKLPQTPRCRWTQNKYFAFMRHTNIKLRIWTLMDWGRIHTQTVPTAPCYI